MMHAVAHLFQDVLQVCRNGHVVTDRLRTCPDHSRHHCERCGTTTLHACLTCGWELPGAIVVPGLDPVGMREPPQFCATCGAPMPWHRRPAQPGTGPAADKLEAMLRRLPQAVRQLRDRWGTRPPFRVNDEHDLEDLVRAFLALAFDGVQLRTRTPSYSPDTRTDFLLPAERIILTLKRTSPDTGASDVEEQLLEDAAYYRTIAECGTLWVCVYDAQGYLREPGRLEALWSGLEERPHVRCVVSR